MPFGGQRHRGEGAASEASHTSSRSKEETYGELRRFCLGQFCLFILPLLLVGSCLTLSAPHLPVDFPSRSHWLCRVHTYTRSLFDQWLAIGRWARELIDTHQCSSLHHSGRSAHPDFMCPQPEAWQCRAPQTGKPGVRMRHMSAKESLCSVAQSCPTLRCLMDCSPPPTRPLCACDSPVKNTGVGCHALLQRIFPTQGLNPVLLHCRWIIYHLSHQGTPRILVCSLFFLQGSPQPRNQTRISCITGGFFTGWATKAATKESLSFYISTAEFSFHKV